jgi:3-methylcrotonyl-CoA carboxylase alpha subunit
MQTLLVANRGEIAARVIVTARRLGLRTVAVFSDPDRDAPHVHAADQAVRIGPASATDSYLNGAAILEAAHLTGASLIHPGYGFLSENADFAQAVADAGLTFVGPPPAAIRAMGLKDAAKARMAAAGVPVVPGYHGADQSTDTLTAAADATGYPVLIKARAGGGGKGMRRVDRPADFADALAGAQREGLASFGDAAVLVERYIATPRHVEVQVLADSHGNVVHLFERDCSLQRRHQKVIEEAPAPGMSADLRAKMGAAAVEAARAIGYVGAGTVEFIADGSDGLQADCFWFMEMNTRLQVEHPVTEAITGLDLVEWQLRVAMGDRLGFAQDDLAIVGHAVEARIYAEDAAAGFLPSPGPIDLLHWPQATAFAHGPLRIDSGVVKGSTITPYYDPMIAKLIAHGPDRATALARLAAGLADCRIAGTTTNLPFLSALVADKDVAAGRVDTGLIARKLDDLAHVPPAPPVVVAAAALAATGLCASLLDPLAGFRAWGPARVFADLDHAGARLCVTLTCIGPGAFEVWHDGNTLALHAEPGPDGTLDLTLGAHRQRLHLHRSGASITVFCGNRPYLFTVPDPLDRTAAPSIGGDVLSAPMPGLVRAVTGAPGDRVAKGTALVVMEAMKMEHTLAAPRDGVIAAVPAVEGASVAQGFVLLTLEPADA